MTNTIVIFFLAIIGGILTILREWKSSKTSADKWLNFIGITAFIVLFLSSWISYLNSKEAEKAQKIAEQNSDIKDSINKSITDSLIKLQSKVIELQGVQLDTTRAILSLSKNAIVKINNQLSETQRLQYPIPNTFYFAFAMEIRNQALSNYFNNLELPRDKRIRLLPNNGYETTKSIADRISSVVGGGLEVNLVSKDRSKSITLEPSGNGYEVVTMFPYKEFRLYWKGQCKFVSASSTTVSMKDLHNGYLSFQTSIRSPKRLTFDFVDTVALKVADYAITYAVTDVYLSAQPYYHQSFKGISMEESTWGNINILCKQPIDITRQSGTFNPPKYMEFR